MKKQENGKKGKPANNAETAIQMREAVTNDLNKISDSFAGIKSYMESQEMLIQLLQEQFNSARAKLGAHEKEVAYLFETAKSRLELLTNIFSLEIPKVSPKEEDAAEARVEEQKQHHMELCEEVGFTAPILMEDSSPALQEPEVIKKQIVLVPESNNQPQVPQKKLTVDLDEIFVGPRSIWAKLLGPNTFPLGRGMIEVKNAIAGESKIQAFKNDLEDMLVSDILQNCPTAFYRNIKSNTHSLLIKLPELEEFNIHGLVHPDLSNLNSPVYALVSRKNKETRERTYFNFKIEHLSNDLKEKIVKVFDNQYVVSFGQIYG